MPNLSALIPQGLAAGAWSQARIGQVWCADSPKTIEFDVLQENGRSDAETPKFGDGESSLFVEPKTGDHLVILHLTHFAGSSQRLTTCRAGPGILVSVRAMAKSGRFKLDGRTIVRARRTFWT